MHFRAASGTPPEVKLTGGMPEAEHLLGSAHCGASMAGEEEARGAGRDKGRRRRRRRRRRSISIGRRSSLCCFEASWPTSHQHAQYY